MTIHTEICLIQDNQQIFHCEAINIRKCTCFKQIFLYQLSFKILYHRQVTISVTIVGRNNLKVSSQLNDELLINSKITMCQERLDCSKMFTKNFCSENH